MALSSSKLFFLTLLFLSILNMASITVSRSLPGTGPGPSLAVRLQSNGSSTECWDSLMELKSCTGEVILFFLNGETHLGPNCCQAIRIIEHHCWPTMLSVLGFTPEEGDILRGYCDGDPNGSGHSPPAPPSPLPSVGPTVIIANEDRSRPGIGPGPSLAVRLQSNGSSTECWESLSELKACTGEVILFFLNGETYLGPNCCQAIRIIEHHCWPTMLSTLGFTPEEGDILRGYCDGDTNNTGPVPLTPPSPPSVGPTVIIANKDHSRP
ncbi:Prolamin-like domain [Macleaya cordata]|uniref:Prolamin-like domain n=1 Tax=Macleaya cordata TaxID=56857 RepID=A0A200Q2B1_MACCD|nr:Prolamin-like domain [Macleaya cordata]